LLDKHNELIVKHDDITVLNKSLESNNMKLKKEHVILEMKYQELELAHEDIGSSGHANAREVTKTNASTSCDDLIEGPKVLLDDENIASSSKTNHARVKALEEEVRSLRSCVKTLAKGEELHKEIVYYNARDYGTRGLVSSLIPSRKLLGLRSYMGVSSMKLGLIVNIARSPIITQGSAQHLLALCPPCLTITSPCTMITISC
jgi:hypothetical protein